jgi:hypothetical protein
MFGCIEKLIFVTSYYLISCYIRQMIGTTRLLDRDWRFTQVGGGQGTENGEWLEVSAFPTSVHVELLHLKIIPDPVSVELNLNEIECVHTC